MMYKSAAKLSRYPHPDGFANLILSLGKHPKSFFNLPKHDPPAAGTMQLLGRVRYRARL